jgi:hypothetical protein
MNRHRSQEGSSSPAAADYEVLNGGVYDERDGANGIKDSC